MKIKWRRKSKTPKMLLERNLKIVADYNNGLTVDKIRAKYGFKDLRQIFNILRKMEGINLKEKE